MNEFNPKRNFSRSFDRGQKKPDSNMQKKGKSSSLTWKPARTQPLNIRMMTTKEGVSERVLHEQPCKIIEKCNYCPNLDLPYKTQLLQKTNELKQSIHSENPEYQKIIIKDCIASEDRFGYRHQIKLIISEHYSNDPVSPKRWVDIGLYNQSFNSVVDIGRCPVQTSLANDIAAFFRTGIRLHNLSIYTPKNREGLIHSLVIRTTHSTRQAQVIINITKDESQLLKPIARELAEKIMNIQGVFAQVVQPQHGDDNRNIKVTKLVGQEEIEEQYSELSIKYSSSTYLPPNPRIYNKIFHRILELADLSGRESILELNSGAGELSCLLAASARNVTAIDASENAVQDANKNARLNSIKNIGFYHGKVSDKLNELISNQIIKNCEVIILNSREEKLNNISLKNIVSLEPKVLFYLSSSSNDIIKMAKEVDGVGYKIVFIEPYDTFPGTDRVLSLCFIQKK
ncbi:methyltransferase domain-containing protein [Pigmentibacter sp. JX0631]|uniref:methyltransferase domain-containing protein n=1 Tax=Pigmentibacter sp. JX0631 TaxID=2976982 RepID=UPI002469BBC6|nr:methyltransferase domain-containing protein [Pigmentibacter sp. JX0631]WGL60369.1 methyltransferase domain-containing protein [Pigmentibacter sp. JX0631]